jgi:uncharacterized protein YdeI (YjbR/CyaY-like superfamily)
MITDPRDYFALGCGRCDRFATPECSTRRWIDGLNALRRICLAAGLTETAKWGHPCYMHAGRNIALIGAHRTSFNLSFMNAGLLKDESGLLVLSGPNGSHPDTIRFTDSSEVERLAPVLSDYLRQAMAHAEAGIKPARESRELVLPEELADALTSDPDLGKAFASLTPGRQRSYVIALSSAKTSATRKGRVAKFRGKILSGKGATER